MKDVYSSVMAAVGILVMISIGASVVLFQDEKGEPWIPFWLSLIVFFMGVTLLVTALRIRRILRRDYW